MAPERWKERDRRRQEERDKDIEKPVCVRDRERGPGRNGITEFRQSAFHRPGLGGQTTLSFCLREVPLQPVAFWGEPRGY